MIMVHMKKLSLLFSILILYSGCNLINNQDPFSSSFSAEITGAVSNNLSGEPVIYYDEFELNTDDFISIYEMRFEEGDAIVTIDLHFKNQKIKSGNYTIVQIPGQVSPSEASGGYGFWLEENHYISYSSQSGELEITKVQGNKIEGSFSFTANRENSTVQVDGSFAAETEPK